MCTSLGFHKDVEVQRSSREGLSFVQLLLWKISYLLCGIFKVGIPKKWMKTIPYAHTVLGPTITFFLPTFVHRRTGWHQPVCLMLTRYILSKVHPRLWSRSISERRYVKGETCMKRVLVFDFGHFGLPLKCPELQTCCFGPLNPMTSFPEFWRCHQLDRPW